MHVGGVEIALTCERADVVEALVGRWRGYEGTGRSPDVVLRYEAKEGWLIPQPAGREYPGYDSSAAPDGELRFARRDSRGTIMIPGSAEGPVRCEFEGAAMPHALDATLRLALSVAVPRAGGLVIHSAGISSTSERRALLFSGPSGAGKSTVSALLEEALPFDHRLGDDLTIARPDEAGTFWAHATPFAGERGPAADGKAPLAGLYFLLKGTRHVVTPIGPHDALRRLMRNVLAYVVERDSAERVLTAASALVAAVPCHVLEFAKDPGVARVLAVT
jgi:hypothetical protein